MSDLIPVDFYGDVILTVRSDDEVRVAVRRVCENLGLHLQTQLEKLKKAAWASCTAIRTTAADSKDYHTTMIPLRAVPMWLAGISEDRVAPHVREKLVRYQLEAADVLAAHFMPATVAAAPSTDLDSYDGLLALSSQLTTKLIATTQRAIAAESKVVEQAEVIAIAAPKARAFDRFLDTEGLCGLQKAGRDLDQCPNLFIKALREAKILGNDGRSNFAYAPFVDRGYFKHRRITFHNDRTGEDETTDQAFFTAEGLAWADDMIASGKLQVRISKARARAERKRAA